MKQRIITAVIGLCVLAVVVVFFNTLLLNIAVCIISVIAVYEVLQAAKYNKHKILMCVSLALAALIPFVTTNFVTMTLQFFLYLFAVILFTLLIARHTELRAEEIGFTFLVSISITTSFTTIIFLRENNATCLSILYVLIALGSAWWSDTFAYFTGRAFGKRKLAPVISPKKTVEGAIGGLFGAVLGNLFIAFLLTQLQSVPAIASYYEGTLQVNYLRIALLSPILSVVSILGDLSASAIKRQFGVKDFGSIMPGHGGVMDRFDSVLFVLPLVRLISVILPLGY